MDRYLIKPIKIHHEGLDTDDHVMDGALLGKSLIGTSKLYNSVGRFYFNGQIIPPQATNIRVLVGPPKPGTMWYLIYMMMVHGQMAMYPELLFELAAMAVPEFVKATVAKKTGQTEMLNKSLDMLERQSERYHELAMQGQQNDMRTREQLTDVIAALATQNKTAMAEMAAPVGKTVEKTRHESENTEPLLIDAATADALTAKSDVSVGDIVSMRGMISALDLNTGAIKFEDEQSGERISGKIVDPALLMPENIYSHSLDTREQITITAKPTLEDDGKIQKIFVSDAKND